MQLANALSKLYNIVVSLLDVRQFVACYCLLISLQHFQLKDFHSFAIISDCLPKLFFFCGRIN